jgi:hypothetical protein
MASREGAQRVVPPELCRHRHVSRPHVQQSETHMPPIAMEEQASQPIKLSRVFDRVQGRPPQKVICGSDQSPETSPAARACPKWVASRPHLYSC